MHGLNWLEFRYAAIQAPQDLPAVITSEEPGIYVFYARPQETFNFLPRFPFYVGVSNERGTNRPLRERLEEYYNIGEIRKRLNVHQMLQMYYQNVWIAYAHINLTGPQMRELEQQLHGFLYPTFGIRDHTVEVKNTSKAFRI